jgi:hypothetical protein
MGHDASGDYSSPLLAPVPPNSVETARGVRLHEAGAGAQGMATTADGAAQADP